LGNLAGKKKNKKKKKGKETVFHMIKLQASHSPARTTTPRHWLGPITTMFIQRGIYLIGR
jgi:hypothetical protein